MFTCIVYLLTLGPIHNVRGISIKPEIFTNIIPYNWMQIRQLGQYYLSYKMCLNI